MQEIYLNAVDSLQVGMQYYLAESTYSSRKHAILSIFHSIELFLKAYLHKVNKVLIYKNIDSKIEEDSLTVGMKEIIVRFENLGKGLGHETESLIKKIQRKRNRIEHHRYQEEEDDKSILEECLKFILAFVELGLEESLEKDIDPNIFAEIKRLVYSRNERENQARHRVDMWLLKRWPNLDLIEIEDQELFSGTTLCPLCDKEYLIVEDLEKPLCCWCNLTVDAAYCEDCCIHYVKNTNHNCNGW